MSLSRRRLPRFRYRAALRITDASAGRAVEATCFDLSTGGIGVRASGVYAVGSDVVCELDVDGRKLALPGVVAWSEPPPAEESAEPAKTRDVRRITQGLFQLGAAAREPEPVSEYVIEVG